MSEPITPVFRFAPSPNGALHIGHALSAKINHEASRLTGGRFLLRIEDIDIGRSRREFEDMIYRDLGWLGLDWETPVRRQSEHLAFYRKGLDPLIDDGLVYPTTMTRAEIARAVEALETEGHSVSRDPDGAPHYPGLERHSSMASRRALMASGDAYALRLDMAKALECLDRPLTWAEIGAGPQGESGLLIAEPAQWGDPILARKDVPTSYHLSVVIDDALQTVTHVVRGQDLFLATGLHRLLQHLLNVHQPIYCHHRLIVDEAGAKLSKRGNLKSIRSLRDIGMKPADIDDLIGFSDEDVMAFQPRRARTPG